VAIRCAPPLHWIAPNAVVPGAGAPPRGCFALRAHAFLRSAQVAVRQDGRALWAGRLPRVQPGRSAALPADWTGVVDPDGGPIEIVAERARLAEPLV
jgi:hypothetical protein